MDVRFPVHKHTCSFCGFYGWASGHGIVRPLDSSIQGSNPGTGYAFSSAALPAACRHSSTDHAKRAAL